MITKQKLHLIAITHNVMNQSISQIEQLNGD